MKSKNKFFFKSLNYNKWPKLLGRDNECPLAMLREWLCQQTVLLSAGGGCRGLGAAWVLCSMFSPSRRADSRKPAHRGPPPTRVGSLATALSGSSPSRNSKGGEEANFSPGNRPLKHGKDGRAVRKPGPPESYLTCPHRLLGSLTLQAMIKPDSVLLGPSFLLSWSSCLTENWARDGIKYICLGCHINI